MDELITERLLLRRFTPADAADVERLAGAWEIADTTLRIPHPYPAGGGAAWIAMHTAFFEGRTAMVFAITERHHGPLVGAIGIDLAEGGREGELGYWVGVPHWGRGYATEAAGAIAAHAFGDAWSLNLLTARYFIRNSASGRVLEKLGMRDIEAVTVYKEGREEQAMLRAITAAEWRARSQPS